MDRRITINASISLLISILMVIQLVIPVFAEDESDYAGQAAWYESISEMLAAGTDVIKQGEIEGLTFDEYKGQFLLLYNRGAKIVAGMPKGFYDGYTEEIHEVFVYEVR